MQQGIAWLEEHFDMDFSGIDMESIEYERKCQFFYKLAVTLFAQEQRHIQSKFENLGIMVDCARNGVPNIPTLKRLIASLALSGYSYVGLYLEDCFEVEEEPLFGYMRGRYTKSEIKEVVEFADMFGIEVVPYIQTLAHLPRLFNHWVPYCTQVRDTNDILLMGEPRTYLLIEHMVKAISESFGKGRINIGMDEAFMMTYGKYRQIHGDSNVCQVFSKHVEKVCEICDKYGMKPEVWADMFLHYKDEIRVPENLVLRAWEYDATDGSYYTNLVNDCKTISNKVTFGGTAQRFYGYVPLNGYAEPIYSAAIKGLEGYTDDFCLTLWGDDGSECSVNAMWYSMLRVGNQAHNEVLNEVELDKLALCITGYKMEELLAMDLPNYVFEGPMKKPVNVSKYMLFSDVFMGLAEKTENPIYVQYFKQHGKRLKKLSKRKAPCAYLYRVFACLCEILEVKNNLRQQIRKAYHAGDKEALSHITKYELPYIIRKLNKFCVLIEEQWVTDYKVLGLEVQIYRLHGLVARVKYIKKTLERYCFGELEKIAELEETDLSPLPDPNAEHNGATYFNSFEQNITYCNLSHHVYL